MKIFEYAVCDDCGEGYKGKFTIKRDGTINCYNCEKHLKCKEIDKEEVPIHDNRFLEAVVKDFLIKDMKRIYEPKSSGLEEQNLEILRKEDGELDERKVYFQGNSLDLIILAHKKAYKCLNYMDSGEGKKELKGFADEVVQSYLKLREVKLGKRERIRLEKVLNSRKMEKIEKELEVR